MIILSLAMMVGTAFAFWGNNLIDPHWITYLPILLLLAWQQPSIRFICLCCAVFLWANLLLQQTLEHRLDPAFDGKTVLISGTITDISEQRRYSTRFYLKPDGIQSYQRLLPQKLRLSWYQDERVPQAGERWQLLVKLRAANGFQNPDAFDYERWLFIKNIAGTGYVKKSDQNRKLTASGWQHINYYRLQVIKAIDRACGDCRHSGLFKALTVGYRGDIPISQDRLLRDTGTAHLLAISGLHIGMIAALFFGLGRFLWRCVWYRSRFNRLECASLLAMVAAVAYAALAGFSLPTVRALVMLSVIVLALLCRKNVNLLNSIAVAVTLILLCDPLAIGSTSFWLSISALLVIAFAQYRLQYQTSRFQQVLIIQFLFSILLIPLGILLFGQAATAGFFANIVAIPVLSFIILPFTLIASLCAVLNVPLAPVLFDGLDRLTGWLLDYLQLLLKLGLQTYATAGYPTLLLLCMAIGLVLCLLPIGWRSKVPALLLLLVALLWSPNRINPIGFQMTVLDVGMGTAVVVQTANHSLVYDFGPGNRHGFSAGEWVVRPFLQYRGIHQPDLMVISHVDSDHSGGFISFADESRQVPVLTGMPIAVEERFQLTHPTYNCHTYPTWQWDGIKFEFLATSIRDTTRSNNQSCVLKISGVHTALLSGDIEAKQEYALLRQSPEKLAANILLAPHHGSLTSSTAAFVSTVSADVVIFTVGHNNRWGFPKAEVVGRYEQAGSRIMRTDEHGAISLLSQADTLSVNYHRRANRIWHDKLLGRGMDSQ